MASFTFCWHLSVRKSIYLRELWTTIYWRPPWSTIHTQLRLDYPTPIGWRNLFLLLNPPIHCLLWSFHTFTCSMWTMFHIFSNWAPNLLNMNITTKISSNHKIKTQNTSQIASQSHQTLHTIIWLIHQLKPSPQQIKLITTKFFTQTINWWIC